MLNNKVVLGMLAAIAIVGMIGVYLLGQQEISDIQADHQEQVDSLEAEVEAALEDRAAALGVRDEAVAVQDSLEFELTRATSTLTDCLGALEDFTGQDLEYK